MKKKERRIAMNLKIREKSVNISEFAISLLDTFVIDCE